MPRLVALRAGNAPVSGETLAGVLETGSPGPGSDTSLPEERGITKVVVAAPDHPVVGGVAEERAVAVEVREIPLALRGTRRGTLLRDRSASPTAPGPSRFGSSRLPPRVEAARPAPPGVTRLITPAAGRPAEGHGLRPTVDLRVLQAAHGKERKIDEPVSGRGDRHAVETDQDLSGGGSRARWPE